MTASLITSFVARPASASSDEYWLHIEQVGQEDNTATVGEVADMLDLLYGIDPCDEFAGDKSNISIGNVTTDNYPPEEDEADDGSALAAQQRFFADVVNNAFDLSLCRVNANGDYITQIKVALSHPGGEYKLNLDNGAIEATTTVAEQYSKSFVIDQADSFELDFPVISGATFSWVGSVAGVNGYKTGPEIYLSGRTLQWGEAVSGTLHVSYATRYDLVDITVFGTAAGELAECRALCFYHGLLDDLTLEKPDVDQDADEIYRQRYCRGGSFGGSDSDDIVTCYETVTKNYVCECTNTPAYSVTEEVEVPCPRSINRCNQGMFSDTHLEDDGKWHCSQHLGSRTIFGDYVSCPDRLYNNQTGQWADNGENSILREADYYEQRCCHAPEGSLPNCQVRYEKNTGGSEIPPEILADYQARYGDQLVLIAVSPEDGDCGYIKTTINDVASNCCDVVELLDVDTDNSADIISDNNSGVVAVTGGRLPFTVSVSGSGFYLDSGRSIKIAEVNGNAFRVYTGDACGVGIVTISDGCSVAQAEVKSTTGDWVLEDTCKQNGGFSANCATDYEGGKKFVVCAWCQTPGSSETHCCGISTRAKAHCVYCSNCPTSNLCNRDTDVTVGMSVWTYGWHC